MLNFFKKPNVNKKFIQSNSHNLIKVDTKYGNLYLLKHDEFITNSFKRGNYWAENEIKIIEDLLNLKDINNLTYFDIGANVGSHILAISKIFKNRVNIYCFEAQKFIFEILKTNISENYLKNVHVFHNAVSDNNNQIKIKIPNYEELNNFGSLELIKPRYSDNNKIKFSNLYEKVNCIQLNDFKEVKVDFIKIDIEGMEHLAIKGGEQLIRKQRPFLLIELIKTDYFPILKIFGELNYKAYLINNENGLFIPNEYDLPIKNLKKIL